VKRHLLLTAVPGAGKTTVIRRVAAELDVETVNGFFTAEMRRGSVRRGFRLVPFHGEPVVIAHVEFAKAQRVGKYGVDVAAIDAAVDTALATRRGTKLYLIDEIGKMECLSERFIARTRDLLAGTVPVVATVAKRGGGFIAEVKLREDCELWTLTRANRDALPFEIINRTH
jgi:nucleoside-triphosphatase